MRDVECSVNMRVNPNGNSQARQIMTEYLTDLQSKSIIKHFSAHTVPVGYMNIIVYLCDEFHLDPKWVNENIGQAAFYKDRESSENLPIIDGFSDYCTIVNYVEEDNFYNSDLFSA